MFYIDPVYFWYVFIPVLVISLGVQLYMRSTFNKWSKVKNSTNLNGAQIGQELFRQTSLQTIRIEHVSGTLSDHFDPGANVVRLSENTARGTSVASMAVTAHELGHVQQYQTGSAMIKARGFLLPALANRALYRKMGLARHLIAWSFVLLMFGVVGKIILRIFFHVKYILTTLYFSI